MNAKVMLSLEEYRQAVKDNRVIILPYPIGTPVIKVKSNQHDGWYIDITAFSYDDIAAYDEGLIFTDTRLASNEANRRNA